MRVARLHGVGEVRIGDEPMPRVSEGESLIKVTAVGLCGSDLHWFGEGGIGDAQLVKPLVLGHEFAGVVAEGPRQGQRVALDPADPCRDCESCREGNPNLCPHIRFAGHGEVDGGMREFLAYPDRLLHPLPDEISDTAGAILEPLGVALHCVDLAHLKPGATVAVVGCGPIGLLLIQLLRASGATQIVAIEPLPHRREAALVWGADTAMAPRDAHDGAVEEVCGGRGVEVAFEVAGVDDAVDLTIRAARPGARIMLCGIPGNDRTSFPAATARHKGLTLVMVRRMRDVYPRAIALVRRGLVDAESLVTARFPLADAATAFVEASQRRGLKTVVEVAQH